jgi:nucleoside-diphosphate-sugar epimerase
MKNINVIGGSGFIGTRLVTLLKEKNHLKVRVTDKSLSAIHKDLVKLGDVRSIEQLRDSITNESVIINLAAEHRDDVRP